MHERYFWALLHTEEKGGRVRDRERENEQRGWSRAREIDRQREEGGGGEGERKKADIERRGISRTSDRS